MEFVRGNLLNADVEALVNTVNCVGVMGKGIALQFKQAFPENYEAYAEACRRGELRPGHMFTFATDRLINPKYIINFPTKRHWRGKSKIEDIHSGLIALAEEIRRLGITSIAVPPLGCGSGGLEWARVRPLIEEALAPIPGLRVLVYEPKGAPEADKMPIATKSPAMTRARALFIKLLEQYSIPGYQLSLLEAQKLAYFLQVAGEPLRLNYVKHKYGPYAENLDFVLQTMEGHFIRGYGDRSKRATIRLLPGASEQAERFLAGDTEAQDHLERIKRLIDGFETPYGMELLASVHWVVSGEECRAKTAAQAENLVLAWSSRKRHAFHSSHIHRAWERLAEQNWLSPCVASNYGDVTHAG